MDELLKEQKLEDFILLIDKNEKLSGEILKSKRHSLILDRNKRTVKLEHAFSEGDLSLAIIIFHSITYVNGEYNGVMDYNQTKYDELMMIIVYVLFKSAPFVILEGVYNDLKINHRSEIGFTERIYFLTKIAEEMIRDGKCDDCRLGTKMLKTIEAWENFSKKYDSIVGTDIKG